MVDKDALILRLIDEEGLRLHPYTDTTGNLTIGIGRNLTEVGITMDEAIYLCKNNIDSAIKDLQSHLSYFDLLPDKVQLVLTDMCFNLGIGNLLTFHNTLKHIKEGDYKTAGEEMLNSKWAKQVGTRAFELSEMLKSI